MKYTQLSLYSLLLMTLSFCVLIGPVLANDTVLEKAYANHQSQVQVQGSGVVIKVLADDNNGKAYQ